MPLPALPVVAAFMAGVLGMALSGMVTRIITGLGISVVTYAGAAIVTDYMVNQLVASLQSLPSQVIQIAGLMKLDVALNIIFGAVNARLGLITMDGFVRRFQLGPGQDNAITGWTGTITGNGSGGYGGPGSGGSGGSPEL